jgi:hypothetical protein
MGRTSSQRFLSHLANVSAAFAITAIGATSVAVATTPQLGGWVQSVDAYQTRDLATTRGMAALLIDLQGYACRRRQIYRAWRTGASALAMMYLSRR